MRCVSVISVRNGIDYIEGCIKQLIENQIEIAIIDQSSDDGTYEVCEKYKDDGVFILKRTVYPGYFSLRDQLAEKYKLIESLNTDWVIHQDVDECLKGPYSGLNLYQSIKKEDNNGFNVINFNEFVFLPLDLQDTFLKSKYYYFFEPSAPRLMRAWKKADNLNALKSGGHILEGDARLAPNYYSLLHYIFTSQQHAYEKYSQRKFVHTETDDGWHLNRINLLRNRMLFPEKSELMEWSNDIGFCPNTDNAWKKHYWEKDA